MSGGWNTIESDAGVFTSLIETLGVKDVQCEELLALDAQELLALQPLYGVIFLFKYPTDGPYADASGPLDGVFDHGAAQDLFFAAQTIQNACATQALLSVLLNQTGANPTTNPNSGDASGTGEGTIDASGTSENAIDVGAELASFREFGMALPPEFRGEALSNSELIRGAHNSFARSSPFADETQRAGADPEDAFHFIAYTPVAGVLYELDGLQPAPISHGACGAGEFPAKVVDVLRRRVARYEHSEIRFNLLAMCRDLRIRAREFGDAELVEREEAKRRGWMVENALRRHNFVGFAGEMLRQVVGDVWEKGGEEGVKGWVRDGLERRRAEERSLGARKKGDVSDKMEE